MKKISLVILFFIFTGLINFAQVGINNDNSLPDASAGLDVKFTNKGFLPPRVSLSDINSALPVTAPAAGLLVYNTATAGVSPNNVVPGYYFWNGTKWFSASVPQGANVGEMLYWNGTQWIIVPTGSEGQVMTFVNGVPTWRFKCGTPVVKSHVAGTVAPVSKTVTYGTTDNIAGEPYKCWITSNLGADHQATAINDSSEASAGWYWQFNRKQGFKQDGTNLTPGNSWITSISENSDWQPENDPCKLELGTQWRIPTSSELYNCFDSRSLPENFPWYTAVKMHLAGWLITGGSLHSRGGWGMYWSSSQSGNNTGYTLGFYPANGIFVSYCYVVSNFEKATGCPLRCLRD